MGQRLDRLVGRWDQYVKGSAVPYVPAAAGTSPSTSASAAPSPSAS